MAEKDEISLEMDVLETLSAGSYQLPAINSNKDLQTIQEIASPGHVKAIQQEESDWELEWGFPFDGGDVQDIAYVREDLPGSGKRSLREQSKSGENLVGVYEGRYVSTFDHRNRTFEGIKEDDRFGRALGKEPTESDKESSGYEIEPRYWVQESTIEDHFQDMGWDHDWLFLYGRKTKDTNERTFMGAITPLVGSTDTAPYLLPTTGATAEKTAERSLVLASITNSYVFDYQSKNYISGTTLGKNLVLRLTMPTFSSIYNSGGKYERLKQISLELSHTSESVEGIADALDENRDPKYLDPDERLDRMAELNAIVGHLYGLDRETVEYIVSQFSLVEKNEIKEFGEFRSKKRILSYFDEYSDDRGDESEPVEIPQGGDE